MIVGDAPLPGLEKTQGILQRNGFGCKRFSEKLEALSNKAGKVSIY